LYSVNPSRPSCFRPGRYPLRHEFRAALAACGLHEKVHEAAEEGTKEGAEIAKKGGEKIEERTPCRPLIAYGAVRFDFTESK
jgi:hypothetical protein